MNVSGEVSGDSPVANQYSTQCHLEWAVIVFYDICPYEVMTYMYMYVCAGAHEGRRPNHVGTLDLSGLRPT